MDRLEDETRCRSRNESQTRSILIRGLLFGGLGGGLELLIFWLKCSYFDRRNFNVSRHFPWMFPASGMLIVGSCAIMLAAASRIRPGWFAPRPVAFGLLFPSIVGVLFRFPISTAACLILAAGLSIRLAAGLVAKGASFEPFARRALVGVVVLIAAAALIPRVSSFVGGLKEPISTKPRSGSLRNVLLIVLDTFRADRLDAIGVSHGLTPNLARYSRRGVRFERAYSTAPWTAPSHASMFTGRWPHELAIGWNQPLEKGPATLAETLAAQGLKTAGFVANTTYCSYETGLDRGFGHYEDYDVNLASVLLCSSVTQRLLNFIHQNPGIEARLPSLNFAKSTRKDASRIRDDFRSWLSKQQGAPFFAFLNLFDTHHPYLSPEVSQTSKTDQRILKTWWDLDKQALPEHDLALARSAYDDCVRYIDRQVGALLDELGRQGRLKETLVVITADHGEHLGERNLYGHGCSLYDAEVHVPLLVIADGVVPEGLVISEPVSLRDLPATVVDLLGIADQSNFPGGSLTARWSRSSSSMSTNPPLLSEIDGPPEVDPNSGRSPVQKGPMRSLILEGLRYIRNGNGVEELYWIEADPSEATNLADDPAFGLRIEQFRRLLREGMEPAIGTARGLGSRGARLGSRAGL